MKQYAVTIGTDDKGVVFWNERANRWQWQRPGGGSGRETYPPMSNLTGVRAHIARVCRTDIVSVKLNPQEEEPCSDAAMKYATAFARSYFDRRKGHGGADGVVYVQVSEAKLAAFMALAFDAGRQP
jgi:hypothetical protein